MIDPRLLRDVQDAEACVLTAYKDTLGNWTIGWGHLLDQTKDWTGHTITQATADAQLGADILASAGACLQLPEWPALDTECRQNAVVELVFNMGPHTWRSFNHTRAAIQLHDWQRAHDGLLTSLWASQVHEKRANRLANYLLTGQY